ncbi:hypothetical protein AB0L41_30190 [Amycolatopsis mediterranei]|uniref:hypothetical protein n=1 Tax=Amycolatopsis mediterranei TaxID=33910 RepID=UPI003442631B
MQKEQLLEYAEELASRLRDGMKWEPSEYGDGYWKATDPSGLFGLIAVATEAREFLRVYAGPDSQWLKQADDLYSNNGERKSRETGIRALGDLLEAWCRQVRRGVVEVVGERTLNEITGTRIDLMGQVRQLLEDKQGHPAAPIMLCGAALEIALRALADAQNVPYPDRPGINKLTAALRTAKLITAQDVKDLDSCAGMRNLAAHGQFDTLSLERAGLMEQATNLLLRRLAEIQAGPEPDQP